MTRTTGRCACGAISYQGSATPRFSFLCQCRDCQRATGGGHASIFILDEDAVEMSGELRFFDRESDAGNTISQGFCPICGSPVFNRNSGYPGSLFFHAATLDEPAGFAPQKVVYRESAQPWDTVNPDL